MAWRLKKYPQEILSPSLPQKRNRMSDLMNFKSDQQRTLLGFLFLLQHGTIPQWLPEYSQEEFEEKVLDAFAIQGSYFRSHIAAKVTTQDRAMDRWCTLFSDSFRMKVLTGLNNAAGRGILVFKSIIENKLKVFLGTHSLRARFDKMFWNQALILFSRENSLDKKDIFTELEGQIDACWLTNCNPLEEERYVRRLQMIKSISPQLSF
jgi:hypothetical protein